MPQDSGTQALSHGDVPAMSAAQQLDAKPGTTSTVPDDVEAQLEDLEGPLFDGPSPPHPHPHFSSRAPWLRAGDFPC